MVSIVYVVESRPVKLTERVQVPLLTPNFRQWSSGFSSNSTDMGLKILTFVGASPT